MFLPDWICRMLPFAYVAVGLVVAIKMDSPIGVGSGVLLVITGLLIWKMRVPGALTRTACSLFSLEPSAHANLLARRDARRGRLPTRNPVLGVG
jgi:hypothetical protein